MPTTETKLRKAVMQLREALRDLVEVIEIDELISDSVSYMKQARKALNDTEHTLERTKARAGK